MKTMITYEQRATENRKVVDAMFRRFERTKAASAFSRQRIAKTGAIDPLRVVNYRLTDDIFRRNTITPKGKSHGVVVFLDWSGSMEDILMDSVNQVMMLADFCAKASVPFEVYLFSDNYIRDPDASYDDRYSDPWFTTRNDGFRCESRVNLVNVLSSRANRHQHERLKRRLYAAAKNNVVHNYDRMFRLGGTPLDSAILASRDLIRGFQQRTGVEIVNAVWITDGEGTCELRASSSDYMPILESVEFVEGNTRIRSDCSHRWSSNADALLRWCAVTTGANIMGIFLTQGKVDTPENASYRLRRCPGMRQASQELLDSLGETFAKDSFVEIPNAVEFGYDRFFVLNPARPKGKTSATIGDDASKIAYRNAMIREGQMRKAQTAMMECVAEAIARGRY